MNTDQLTIARSPDRDEQRFLRIELPGDLAKLSLRDRISFRIGLWLLRRPRRPDRRLRQMQIDARREESEREALALLTYGLQQLIR